MTMDFIEPSVEFQTSVNIAYDLNNLEKVKSFIPTSSAVSILERILLSTDSASTDRASILIGAYGKGKSHIVLAILSLLYHKKADVLATLLENLKETKPDIYEAAVNYLDSDKRLLPVIISVNSNSLTQTFLRALYSTLKQHDLVNIMPETNFAAALKNIQLWENEYPAVYENLQKLLSMPVELFEKALEDYDAEAYATFERIYPQLTAGTEFNPFNGYDVPELYENVCNKLPAYGYSGLFVVYDEFSKYLEASISKASINDIKMLQDFAEKCTRSGKNQLHLLLISHKEIENYIDVLPKQKVDGWRGVSERFAHINMQNDYPQTYEIIGAAIKKEPNKWAEFKKEHSEYFDNIRVEYSKKLYFADCTNKQRENALVDCYPLHPLTTFILPRLSEKVAQNERTLFTFIAGNDAFSLKKLIDSHDENGFIVTPDYLYDYFAPQMRKEAITTDAHKLYVLSNEILTKVEKNSLAEKIVKTLSVIYCIGQFNILAPTVEIILSVYQNDQTGSDEIIATINSLIKKQLVVYLKRSNSFLQLKKTSGVDIYAEIEKVIEKRRSVVRAADVLNNANVEPYLYPIRYNDTHSMTRYFSFLFVSAEDMLDGNKALRQINNQADGTVYGILPESEKTAADLIATFDKLYSEDRRTVCVFSDEQEDIIKELRMFDAVTLLRNDCADDEDLKNEYDIIYQDLHEVINRYIAQYIHPELHSSQYWYKGSRRKIYRKSHLTQLLSEICEEVFPDTPVINNEVINKNRLTTVAINSRTKLLTALMQKNLQNNLGLSGSGQEVSFMRSTILLPGLLKETEFGAEIRDTSDNTKLNYVLQLITDFFESTKGTDGTSFADLYDRLTGEAYGIGMRKGIIPIYIAVVLRKYDEHVLIRDRFGEVKLTPALLSQINENPAEYTILVEEWTDEKEEYIKGLAALFADNIIEKEKQYSTYSYIVMAMGRWYLSLPKYVKEAKRSYVNGEYLKINKMNRDFLALLKQASVGAQELLFVRVPKCFGTDHCDLQLVDEIEKVKEFYDCFKSQLEDNLIADTRRILGDTTDNGLAAAALKWVESLNENAKNKLYQNGAERVLPILNNPGNDEHKLINKLGRTIIGLRMEDWNDDCVVQYINGLTQFYETINEENNKSTQTKQQDESLASDHYSVTFVDENGNAKQRTFERTAYGKRAKLLYNIINTNLEEMGHSISPEEKRQVLMEILETMC